MSERLVKPLLIAFSCITVASCGGGGGGAIPPSHAITGPGVAISQTTRTVTPSDNAGGAHPIQITEYGFANLASNAGGLAIAHDGSVWTLGSDTSSTPGFLRFANGAASFFAIPPLNAFAFANPNNDMAATGSSVYGEVGNNDVNTGLLAATLLYSVPVSGGTPSIAAAWPTADTIDPGTFCCIFGQESEVWLSVAYMFSDSQVYNIPGATTIFLPGNPTALADGPDKNIWVGANASNVPGEFLVYALDGTLLHTFPVEGMPTDAVAGPDGALWFLAQSPDFPGAMDIGRITTSGTVTYYHLKTPAFLGTITVGSDGALWFTESNDNKIGRITTSGKITDYKIPTPNSDPWQIVGPGSGCAAFTLWFAEQFSGKIALVHYQ